MTWIVVYLMCWAPGDCREIRTRMDLPVRTVRECQRAWMREFGGFSYGRRHYRFITCYLERY